MTVDTFLVFLSGALVFSAGVELGVWHILAGPDRPNYPTSGKWKRRIMFCFMATLLYRGLELMFSAPTVTEAPTEGILPSAVMLFAFFTVMLIDHCRNWLPARIHERIRQLLRIAACRPNKGLVAARTRAMQASTGAPCPAATVVPAALVELALQGVRVSGPNEGPEAFQ